MKISPTLLVQCNKELLFWVVFKCSINIQEVRKDQRFCHEGGILQFFTLKRNCNEMYVFDSVVKQYVYIFIEKLRVLTHWPLGDLNENII